MTEKEYQKFIGTLDPNELYRLMILSLDSSMMKLRQEIWDKNYQRVKNTHDWITNIKIRDELLEKQKLTDKEKVKLEKIEEWINNTTISEYYDMLVRTFKDKA